MKRGLVPGGAVLMGLVVALAMLGVGYGLFSDTLRISGAVATGSVNAAFSLHEVDEGLPRGAPGGPSDNGVNEDKEFGGRDIAECRVRIAGRLSDAVSDVAPDAASDVRPDVAHHGDVLFVLLHNAYPSFNCYVDFDVHNAGSIPIKVNRPVFGPLPPPNVVSVNLERCYEDGVEIEPGREALCTLHVHVEREAEPGQVYRFGARICVYQWNAGTSVRCPIPTDVEPLPTDLEPAARPDVAP